MKFAKIANAGNEYVNNFLVLEKEAITQKYNKEFHNLLYTLIFIATTTINSISIKFKKTFT